MIPGKFKPDEQLKIMISSILTGISQKFGAQNGPALSGTEDDIYVGPPIHISSSEESVLPPATAIAMPAR